MSLLKKNLQSHKEEFNPDDISKDFFFLQKIKIFLRGFMTKPVTKKAALYAQERFEMDPSDILCCNYDV